MISLIALGLVLISSIVSDENDPSLLYFLSKGVDSPNGVADFFKTFSNDDVNRLAFHPNPQLAIYAEWEAENRRAVSFSSIDQQRLSRARFCGFVSGRLGIRLPDWWFDFFQHPEPIISLEMYKDISETAGIRHKTNLVLTEISTEAIRLVCCGKEIEFDGKNNLWERIDENGTFFDDDTPVDSLSLEITKDGHFLLVVLPIDGAPTLFCVEKSGRGLWKSEIRKCRQINASTNHSPRGLVEVFSTGDKVAVFWRNECEVTLDVFNLNTGSQEISFTTLTKLQNGRAGLPFSEVQVHGDTHKR